MSYHVYNTEGLILSSIPMNEASRYLTIFTKDLGMVRSIAQGVRENRSKLRYSLQDLFLSKVSFVRGREVWRLVNAERMTVSDESLKNKRKALAISKIAFLLKRLIHGETRDEELFEEVKKGLIFLELEDLTESEAEIFSLIIASRILERLGYWPEKYKWGELFDFSEWSKDVLVGIIGKEGEISGIITKSISESHL